mgnify:FL=1
MTEDVVPYRAQPLSTFSGLEGQSKMIELADEFRAICAEREKSGKKWLVPIGPSKHATIEAWQYLGQRAGIIGRTAETREIRNPATGEYEGALAVAEAYRLDTGEIVGRAEQVCYADEVLQRKDGLIYRRWDGPDGRPQRHAVLGMAQTRAQSRVLASVLRFLAEMAGLEGTPAEEMDGVRDGKAEDERAPVQPPARKSVPPDAAADSAVEGLVEDVSEKTGRKKDGQSWTRYGIKINGMWYGTFDKKIADYAREAKNMGEAIRLTYETDAKGYLSIIAIGLP